MNVLRYGNRVANIAVLASVCFGCGDADQDLQLVQQSNSLRFVNVSPPPSVTETRSGFLAVTTDDVELRYGSLRGGRQQDTLTFVSDPSAIWETGLNAPLPDLGSRGVGVSWTGCEQQTCAAREYAEVDLACADYYWSGIGAAACALTDAPPPVVAYYSYDRGGCSKRLPTGDVMQDIADTATQVMYDEVADADPGLASTESHQHAGAQTAIWTENGLTGVGGFQVNLKLDVNVTGIIDYYGGFIPVYGDYEANGHVTGRYRWTMAGHIAI